MQIDDVRDLLAAEAGEDEDFIDPIEKFGAEELVQLPQDSATTLVSGGVGERFQAIRGGVAGHDDDGVGEIHAPALAIGQAAVVENLQKNVEDFGVRLLDFIQQHDAERDGGGPLR